MLVFSPENPSSSIYLKLLPSSFITFLRSDALAKIAPWFRGTSNVKSEVTCSKISFPLHELVWHKIPTDFLHYKIYWLRVTVSEGQSDSESLSKSPGVGWQKLKTKQKENLTKGRSLANSSSRK